ncbi:hypothetical protein NP493_16g05010 [Ridgeia piscesae]|uniref:Uncharacterized protein n=1 Tax=Ridgeia piscesae TaxID=27915 RepID=A0AAD9PEN6_RIDPI|nr:hypothetical protein NP493_16g05010 [Ridgeia piscesae]
MQSIHSAMDRFLSSLSSQKRMKLRPQRRRTPFFGRDLLNDFSSLRSSFIFLFLSRKWNFHLTARSSMEWSGFGSIMLLEESAH